MFTCSSHCVYLQQEVRVEEEENPEHTVREEDTPHPKTTEEEQHQSPSAPNRRAFPSSLLVNILGQTFTDARVQQQPMSAYARAEGEVTKYCSASPLSLSEDPLS